VNSFSYSTKGCTDTGDVFSQFASSGVVQVVAKDRSGRKIRNLNNTVTLSMPTLKDSGKKAKNSCVGYRNSDSRQGPWKCDSSAQPSNKVVFTRRFRELVIEYWNRLRNTRTLSGKKPLLIT